MGDAMLHRGRIKAVVAYEPGQFAFPEVEHPRAIPAKAEGVDEAMQRLLNTLECRSELCRNCVGGVEAADEYRRLRRHISSIGDRKSLN